MTLLELENQIAQIRNYAGELADNYEIVIPDSGIKHYMGSTPVINVKAVKAGFDRDAGKLFIYPQYPVTAYRQNQ